jgi:serine/threonine-protein kinase HipA
LASIALRPYLFSPDELEIFLFHELSHLSDARVQDSYFRNSSCIVSNLNNKKSLSPAYDLLSTHLLVPDDSEELALPIQGEKRKLKRSHFEAFGSAMKMPEKAVENTFKRFKRNLPFAMQCNAMLWIDHSFLSLENQENLKALMKTRSESLFL